MIDVEYPEKKTIVSSFYSKRYNKSQKLINNKNPDLSVEAKRRWFEFEFTEPVYVSEISIIASGYNSGDRLEIVIYGMDGREKDYKIKYEGVKFHDYFGFFATGFKFRPGTKYFSLRNQLITSIDVVGYDGKEFNQLEDAVFHLDKYKVEVEKKEQEVEDNVFNLDDRIKNLTLENDKLKKESDSLLKHIGEAKARLDDLKAEIKNEEQKEISITEKIHDLENEISTKSEESRNLSNEITKNKRDLSNIKDQIRLFPSEISGFVKEGGRAIRNYVFFSMPFILVILYVTHSMFSKAADLTYIYKVEDFDIWAVFLTRLPFVIVSVTILQVCGFALSRFVFEIMQINKQRLNLSKLSIVAKDVSTASASQLNLSDEEKYEMETHLKMELLREHMKQYVGDEFKYKNGKIEKILPEWLGGSKSAEVAQKANKSETPEAETVQD